MAPAVVQVEACWLTASRQSAEHDSHTLLHSEYTVAFKRQSVRAHLEQIVWGRGCISRASSRRGGCLTNSSCLHQLHGEVVGLSTLKLFIRQERNQQQGDQRSAGIPQSSRATLCQSTMLPSF
jgi:hypothetical protein